MELLRLATVGSVDDGKSTLIGRFLFDSKAIFEDQLEAIEQTSRRRGSEYLDLSLLTDGLRAEREQGITIDVAYRYFATPRRKFIIADTPGHIQYTRNMVTGASTADVALILVDARLGIVEQIGADEQGDAQLPRDALAGPECPAVGQRATTSGRVILVTLAQHLSGWAQSSSFLALLTILGFALALRGRRLLFAVPALAFTLAPRWIRYFTISILPCNAALLSGVEPLRGCLSLIRRAARPRSLLVASRSPLETAWANASRMSRCARSIVRFSPAAASASLVTWKMKSLLKRPSGF